MFREHFLTIFHQTFEKFKLDLIFHKHQSHYLVVAAINLDYIYSFTLQFADFRLRTLRYHFFVCLP